MCCFFVNIEIKKLIKIIFWQFQVYYLQFSLTEFTSCYCFFVLFVFCSFFCLPENWIVNKKGNCDFLLAITSLYLTVLSFFLAITSLYLIILGLYFMQFRIMWEKKIELWDKSQLPLFFLWWKQASIEMWNFEITAMKNIFTVYCLTYWVWHTVK